VIGAGRGIDLASFVDHLIGPERAVAGQQRRQHLTPDRVNFCARLAQTCSACAIASAVQRP